MYSLIRVSGRQRDIFTSAISHTAEYSTLVSIPKQYSLSLLSVCCILRSSSLCSGHRLVCLRLLTQTHIAEDDHKKWQTHQLSGFTARCPLSTCNWETKNIGLYGEKSDSCRWRFNCTMLKITRSFVHLPVFQLKLASLFCEGTMVINYNLFSFPPVDICSSSYRSFSPDSVSLSRCLLSEIPNLSSSRPTGVTRGKEAVKSWISWHWQSGVNALAYRDKLLLHCIPCRLESSAPLLSDRSCQISFLPKRP